MVILDIKPATNQGGGAMRLLAVFDLRLSNDIIFYGLKLLAAPDGRHVVSAPSANGGRRTATFSSALAAEITAAAISSFERHATADGTSSKN